MRSRFFSFQSQREFTSCLHCSAQLCLSQQTAALRGQLLAAVTTLPRNARSEPESHRTTASARAQPPTGKQDSKSWSWMPPCLLHLLLFQCPTPLTSPCPRPRSVPHASCQQVTPHTGAVLSQLPPCKAQKTCCKSIPGAKGCSLRSRRAELAACSI